MTVRGCQSLDSPGLLPGWPAGALALQFMANPFELSYINIQPNLNHLSFIICLHNNTTIFA